MKCVITVLQHKRVVMPYLFGKYGLPLIYDRFRGDIKLYHIFHTASQYRPNMVSSRDLGEDRLELVEEWIRAQKYPNAEILRTSDISGVHPALPPLQYATKVAIEDRADFHLWLEDDAIVYDLDCGSWATTLGCSDVGLYADTRGKQHVNTAYFLSTQEFDRRFDRILHENTADIDVPNTECEHNWHKYKGHGSFTEHLAWRAARSTVYLGDGKAYRHHPYPKFRKTGQMVREWLSEHIVGITPEDLDLLALDFQD